MSIADDVSDLTDLVVKHGWDNIARDAVTVMLCGMMRDVLGRGFQTEVEARLQAYSEMETDNPAFRAAMVSQMRYLITGSRDDG